MMSKLIVRKQLRSYQSHSHLQWILNVYKFPSKNSQVSLFSSKIRYFFSPSVKLKFNVPGKQNKQNQCIYSEKKRINKQLFFLWTFSIWKSHTQIYLNLIEHQFIEREKPKNRLEMLISRIPQSQDCQREFCFQILNDLTIK